MPIGTTLSTWKRRHDANKLVTPEQLLAIIGPRPRSKTVILCEGTFDLLHPGHLRHLVYAREKADVLVAAVTADAFVGKGENRPYVPEELRAGHLAALEMVDYAVIDRHPTPVELILALQPDYFAKGYEYQEGGIRPATQVEMDALATYGGEMIFTPGDIVYHSTALLRAQPEMKTEKLLALMEPEGLTFDGLRAALGAKELRVHVVGDAIVDGYSACSLLGAAPKTPTFSVKHEGREQFSGGAAIVAKHLQAAGAAVTFSTVLGADALSHFVVDDLRQAGICVTALRDHSRPTTLKERYVAGGYQLLQVDTVDNHPISEAMLAQLLEAVAEIPADVVILSDFRHGIFNRHTIQRLADAIPKGALSVADSQVSNRWGNILDFRGFDLIVPNEREARFALGDQDSGIRPLAADLYREAHCRYLLLKLGERGMLGYRSPGPNPREFFQLDSFVRGPVDAVGAGDALLAYAALALASTSNIVTAAILGSLGAAVSCERQGNVPVTPAEIEVKINDLERKAMYA